MNRWWKLALAAFFLAAAVERAIYGGSTPGIGPTILYALCGVLFLLVALRFTDRH